MDFIHCRHCDIALDHSNFPSKLAYPFCYGCVNGLCKALWEELDEARQREEAEKTEPQTL